MEKADDREYEAMRTGSWRWKAGAAALLVLMSQWGFDGSVPGSVLGGFALLWLLALAATRPTIRRSGPARIALAAAALFALALVDDPSLLAWALFWCALSLAALLPARGWDGTMAWTARLAAHGLLSPATPLRDVSRLAAVRRRRGRASLPTGLFFVPLVGTAVFVALFAGANPLVARWLGTLAIPDAWEAILRIVFALLVGTIVWTSLRARAIALPPPGDARVGIGLALPTLVGSLATFNALFAVENALDLAFLWSGAPLPEGVTMADYAHRGAYPLIAVALLAALFVLVALRPGTPAAASPAVRRLVTLWIAQTVLLTLSSIARTLAYVDAYGMTVLRLSALAWMALVAVGLALIAWRLLAGRSARWLIDANALAATLVLGAATFIDPGAVAADWNVRAAIARGRTGPALDLCYLAQLGAPAVVPLARLERVAAPAAYRDEVRYLRVWAETYLVSRQSDWRSWTWRGSRRLADVRAIAGPRPARLNAAPVARACVGTIPTLARPQSR